MHCKKAVVSGGDYCFLFIILLNQFGLYLLMRFDELIL